MFVNNNDMICIYIYIYVKLIRNIISLVFIYVKSFIYQMDKNSSHNFNLAGRKIAFEIARSNLI